MTRYIAAYDTEKAVDCLAACQRIRELHEEFDFPGTFFIVGQRLEEAGAEYRDLLGTGASFELASHTYSHKMLRDHPFCGPAPDRETRLQEIRQGKALVEQTFARPCVGLRPGCGFAVGLRGNPWLVNAVAEAGFGYVSSLLWGPDTTMPALLRPPFTYADEGHPELVEMPGHGWQENLLKLRNLKEWPCRLLAWPSPFPEGASVQPVKTPDDEFAINRLFIDRAVELELPYVSLIWHPWSLAEFDPQMNMLELTFSYVRERGLEPTTFAAECQRQTGET